MSLFEQQDQLLGSKPLAYLLRPQTLEEFFGHEEIVGPEKILRQLIQNDNLHSIILWGPPGCGKTTLASIIAHETNAAFEQLSAVSSGKAEIKQVITAAKERKKMGDRTILFIDEIHRFNKVQQDFLLPYVEDGTVTFVGATTENPSFELVSALLSRSQVFVLKALPEEALKGILERAIKKVSELLNQEIILEEAGKELLINFSNGDARNLLNTLEIVLKLLQKNIENGSQITTEEIKSVLQRKNLNYDKNGEEHYNLISALHKSMRDSDPDGALYWMVRMLEGGEDPLYIARRLIRFASEDIGLADPNALNICVSAKEACHFVGMPECGVNLAQAAVYLSVAPKSNALYAAYNSIQADIKSFGNLEVPLHIRNAPTKLMKELNYGKNYQYAHDFKDAIINQQHLPDRLHGKIYYKPTDRGIEAKIQEKLKKIREMN